MADARGSTVICRIWLAGFRRFQHKFLGLIGSARSVLRGCKWVWSVQHPPVAFDRPYAQLPFSVIRSPDVRSPVKRRTVPKHSQTRTLKEPPCQGGWINLRVCYAQNTASLFSLSLSLPCPVLVPVASWLPLVVFVVTMYSRCRLAHAVTSQDSASHCVESCTKTGRTFMVWCEGPCQSWYHPSCLGQTQSKVEYLSTWRCPPCLNSRPVDP
jgi:hypothetical protein